MQSLSLRPVLAPVLGVAICLLVSPHPGAALRVGPLQRFTARAVSVVDSKDVGPIDILVDQHFGLGEPASYSRAELQEFNLLDIRIGPDGKGFGKVARAKDVTYNKQTKMFEVKNYGELPARLVDVHVEKMTEMR